MLVFISIAAVLATVGIHFETIALAQRARWPGVPRFRLALAVLVIVAGHLIEILVFAGGWALLIWSGDAQLSIADPQFTDLLYFSGSVYTSLGFGDILPVGICRLYSVVEAVNGLVLIAWTASYTFLQMQKQSEL